MTSTKAGSSGRSVRGGSFAKLAMAALLALGLLALFAGPASAMKYSLNIAKPNMFTGTMSAGGMATDSAGNLYLADGGYIEKFNSSGKYLSGFPASSATAGYLLDVDVDPAGNIWAIGKTAYAEFGPTGTLLKSNSTVEQSYALTANSTGCVWSAGWTVGWALSAPAGCPAAVAGGNNSNVSDIDADSVGNVWIGRPDLDQIGVYRPETGTEKKLSAPGAYGGLAADNSGNVWVVEPGGCRVRKYSSTGSALASFGTCGSVPGTFTNWSMPFRRPGIAWGPGGVLWVSNGYEVQKWIP
jgi:hypothetical protein